jgi:pimeloyl-ACP methyl ester carboxylesterase
LIDKKPESTLESHTDLWRLDVGKDSFAIWSLNPTGRALVFVHGFGGTTIRTWPRFWELLPSRLELAGYDLIFYGYEGLKARTYPSALVFKKFLADLFGNPSGAVVNPSLEKSQHRAPSFQYETVTIVGHSTGAIVTRQALLEAERDAKTRKWLPRIQLIFFAPAHTGATIAPLIWLDVLEDGKTIADLQARTWQSLLLSPNAGHLVAKLVILGELDNVVNQDRFCEDPEPKVIDGATHQSVCKPNFVDDEPIKVLIGGI